jgi:hypothetical protein
MAARGPLQDEFEELDAAGRVRVAGGTTTDGRRVRFEVAADFVEGRPSATVTFWSSQVPQAVLAVNGQIDTRAGEARMRAVAQKYEYYWWLGGDEQPRIEGTVLGHSFNGTIDEDGRPPFDISLSDLPPHVLDVVVPLGPAITRAAQRVAPPPEPPTPDSEEINGPGAWAPQPRRWWKDWKISKHLCWGVSAAAGSLVCAAAGLAAGPVGMVVGCPAAALVFGTAGSMCSDREERRAASTA